ncbi:MAG TPA: hypothetical protein VF011_04190 [Terriglobales bacterium]
MRLKRYREKGILNPPSLLGEPELGPIEEEHVSGRKHDPHLVAPVGLASHRQVTRNREAAGVSMKFEPNRTKRVALILKSCSVFLELLSERMWQWALWLEEEAETS